MKTIKLYDEMPYSTDFKATVVEVNKNEIILDQTLFFPEEGGQECDLGLLMIFLLRMYKSRMM